MRSFLRLLRQVRSSAWLALFGFFRSPAAAAESCQIHVTGPEQARWQSPALELRSELRVQGLTSACRSIVLDAVQGRVRLIFTKDDGRIAERWLEDSVELLPTVQALSVAVADTEGQGEAEGEGQGQGEAEPMVAPKGTQTAARESSRARMSDTFPSTQLSTAPNPYALSPLFGAQVGFRGGADRLITPTAGVSVALMIDRWELGLLGRYEAHYVAANGENDRRPETSGMVVGSNLGFRSSLGAFALRGGGSLLLAALREDGGAKDGRAEARIGAYLGGVFPKESKLRFRLELGAELVPHNIGQSEQNATGEWSLPWWAFTLGLGAELG